MITAPRPTFSNSPTHYGAVARTLHWLTALLILSAIGLALYTETLPRGTEEGRAALVQIFSLHKTIGVAAFFTALTRILWALFQTKPVEIHPERHAENFVAHVIHWMLYAAMLIMPLSGWIYHSASVGYAQILWSLPQALPFVPQSETLANAAMAIHKLSAGALYAAIGLHIAGALKHVVIDKDGTLARMITGRPAGPAITPPANDERDLKAPLLAAAIWAALIAVALVFPEEERTAPAPTPEASTQSTAQAPQDALHDSTVTAPAMDPATAPATGAATAPKADTATQTTPAVPAKQGNWAMTEGTLGIAITQMGAQVTGAFQTFTPTITFDEATRTGDVTVIIPIGSLTIGSVTDQAMSADFFDAATFPEATFTGTIAPDTTEGAPEDQLAATGTLTLKGATLPLTLPFTLDIVGDEAKMSGSTALNRLDYNVGESYADEATVAHAVTINVELTAQRQ